MPLGRRSSSPRFFITLLRGSFLPPLTPLTTPRRLDCPFFIISNEMATGDCILTACTEISLCSQLRAPERKGRVRHVHAPPAPTRLLRRLRRDLVSLPLTLANVLRLPGSLFSDGEG